MRRLGSHYVLSERLGRGATGEVWRGEREADGTPVAVKILRAELADDDEVVDRFLRERRVLLAFDHPHLVKVRDLVAEGGTLAIVMDLVDGVDLRGHLRRHGPLEPAEAVRLAAEVLDALGAVHRQGVVHRDVKPENILVDTTDPGRPRAMLTDFGIARLAHGPAMTRLTGLIGTPRYMAPELSDGTRATPSADLYSLGVVLYELLSGRPPFDAEHPIAMLRAHLEQTPAPLDELPGTLWPTLARLLAKTPADRPGTAGQARLELTTALPGAPNTTTDPNGPGSPDGPDHQNDPDATMISTGGSAPAGKTTAGADRSATPDETIISPRLTTPLPATTAPETALPATADPTLNTLLSPVLASDSPVTTNGPAKGGAAPSGPAAESIDAAPAPAPVASPGRARPGWPVWVGVAAAAAVLISAGSWALAAAGGGGGGGDQGSSTAAVVNPLASAGPGKPATATGTAATTTATSAAANGSGTASPSGAPSPSATADVATAGPGPTREAVPQPAHQTQPNQANQPTAQPPAQTTDDGRGTVPGVVGQTLDGAAATLKQAGFNNLPYLYNCYGGSAGRVVSQNPSGGTRLDRSAPVRLQVEANNCAKVPDVRGLSLSAAAAAIKQRGFNNIPYIYECLGSTALLTVITQSPAPGTDLVISQPVELHLQANNC
ncbi:serine/threonine protein kinase [Parafrankia irregularis]|uniref:non-specific serine/threonine protein kinase n=1 Tax=Parafrankia irregularis TaxID=795642 RepID=A0A0S4QSI0_9ACTN|nr:MULTISPECIES: serine/threonine-protein kinase [Parafrankia]MBE3204960.1 protein kinase [Parafrankia sp. CH37]CUU58565.1 serine/threonine protein kinase [Parafrankia irregularis]